MSSDEMVTDLVERLQYAAEALAVMATNATTSAEQDRLMGKAKGVQLALSYVMEMRP